MSEIFYFHASMGDLREICEKLQYKKSCKNWVRNDSGIQWKISCYSWIKKTLVIQGYGGRYHVETIDKERHKCFRVEDLTINIRHQVIFRTKLIDHFNPTDIFSRSENNERKGPLFLHCVERVKIK